MTTRLAVAIVTCAAVAIAGYGALLYSKRKYGSSLVGAGEFAGATVFRITFVGAITPVAAGIAAATLVFLLWRK
jgi:hypothetical protein